MTTITNKSVYSVFATVFSEGQAAPLFCGTTEVPLVSESKLRTFLLFRFPTIRKASMCLLAQNTPLGCARPVTPSWFERAMGRFLFAEGDARPTHAQLVAKISPPLKRVKKKVKRALKKVAKKISRASKKLGHSKRKK